MRSSLLALKYLDVDSVTAEQLRGMLLEIFEFWNVVNKVTHIVADAGPNIKKALELLDQYVYVPCVGHKLNLVVKDAFKLVAVRKSWPENIQKTIKENNERVTRINDTITKCKKVVGVFRHSSGLTRMLRKRQTEAGIDEKKLIQDVPTRWNTTFDMIVSVVSNWLPIVSIFSVPKFQKYRKYLLDDYEVEFLDNLVTILRAFKDITVELSGSYYPTVSSTYPLIYCLKNVHSELENYRNELSRCSALKIQASLDERFSYLFYDENEPLFLAATYLDFNYKQFAFIESERERQNKLQTAKNYIFDLFDNIQSENDNIAEPTPNRKHVHVNLTSTPRVVLAKIDNNLCGTQSSIKPTQARLTQQGSKATKDGIRGTNAGAYINRSKFYTKENNSGNQNGSNSNQRGLKSTVSGQTNNIASIENENNKISPSFVERVKAIQLQNEPSENNVNDSHEALENELERFQRDKRKPRKLFNGQETKINALCFFRDYSTDYPLLSKVARNLLYIPATSVPAECLFSHVGQTVTALRNRLNYEYVEALTFIRENMELPPKASKRKFKQ